MKKMSIGKVAKICNVKIDTVRYYERMELIPKATRTDAGYRMFDAETSDYIRFIKNSQQLGFSLVEIKCLLQMSQSLDADCGDVKEMAFEKKKQIEEKISGLKKMKKTLDQLIEDCSGKGAPLRDCSILETLSK